MRVCRELLTGRRRIEAVPPPWHGGACRDLSEWQAWYSDPSFLTNTNTNTDTGEYKRRRLDSSSSTYPILISRFFRSQVSNCALSAPFICFVSLARNGIWNETCAKIAWTCRKIFLDSWGLGDIFGMSCHVSCPLDIVQVKRSKSWQSFCCQNIKCDIGKYQINRTVFPLTSSESKTEQVPINRLISGWKKSLKHRVDLCERLSLHKDARGHQFWQSSRWPQARASMEGIQSSLLIFNFNF